MENNLEQQVAELVAEMAEVAFGDGIGHLVGFLKRLGCDRLKALLEVPWAAGTGRAQGRHDLDQPGYVAGRFQGGALAAASP
jgi:hypothetical protein